MKGAVLALLCAAALVSAELNENGCPRNPYVDILKPHPICNKFYQCVQGELLERKCASDLSFNEETQECDWAVNVDCGERPVAPESNEESGNDSSANGNSNESGNNSNSNGDSSNEDSENNSNSNENGNDSESNSSSNESENDSDNNNNAGNGNPGDAEEICSRKDSNGVLVPHEECDKFYKCAYGVPVALFCNSGLLYNIEKEQCDWPENVNCGSRDQGGNGDNGNDNNSGNGDADKDDEEADKEDGEADNDEGNSDNNNNNGNGKGNGNPSEAPEICAGEGSDGVLVAHENCNQFYKCSEGVPVALSCNLNLLYNYETEQCDWPENVNCEGRDGDNGNDNNSETGEADREDEKADKDEETNGDGDNNNDNAGGNSDPSQALEICAKEDSDSVLVAHENCNQFYVCKNGLPLTLDCNPNLVFNPVSSSCDWPEKVDCSTRRAFTSLNKHVKRLVKLFA